jgi:hypothetical protein
MVRRKSEEKGFFSIPVWRSFSQKKRAVFEHVNTLSAPNDASFDFGIRVETSH